MTDNEIIKALECCTKGNTSDVCSDCPLLHTDICTEEENGVMKLALDLINRQNAEIERLKGLKNHRQELINELNKGITEAKAEAVKEFADRLKSLGRFTDGDRYYIDKIKKEMVGENND